VSYGKDFAEFGMEYAQENGVDYAEARLINGQRTMFFLRNGVLFSGMQRPWLGIGFRVLKNGGLSFVSIEELSKKNVRKT
jgi:predicted Zn-dependent protease